MGHVGNPRHQTPQGQPVTKHEAPQQIVWEYYPYHYPSLVDTGLN